MLLRTYLILVLYKVIFLFLCILSSFLWNNFFGDTQYEQLHISRSMPFSFGSKTVNSRLVLSPVVASESIHARRIAIAAASAATSRPTASSAAPNGPSTNAPCPRFGGEAVGRISRKRRNGKRNRRQQPP